MLAELYLLIPAICFIFVPLSFHNASIMMIQGMLEQPHHFHYSPLVISLLAKNNDKRIFTNFYLKFCLF